MNLKSISVLFSGRVQKVGFRYFVLRQAVELGVNGFVKNLPEGTVYMEAESTEKNLEILVRRCEIDPPQSNVTSIEKRSIPLQNFTNFTIR